MLWRAAVPDRHGGRSTPHRLARSWRSQAATCSPETLQSILHMPTRGASEAKCPKNHARLVRAGPGLSL